MAIAPGGKIIASASVDGTIKLWQPNGKLLLNLQNSRAVYSIAWSPDGKILVSGDTNGNIVSIAFAPNGKFLASRSFGYEEIKLWNIIITNKLVSSLTNGSVGGVNSLVIDPISAASPQGIRKTFAVGGFGL